VIRAWAALASVLLLAAPAIAQTGLDARLRAMGLVGYPANEQAPVFSAPMADGRRLALSGLRGNVVVLTFWATWCEPCRDDMKLLEVLQRDLGAGGLVVVGVNARESPAAIADFGRAHGLTFRLVQDVTGDVGRAYGVLGLPTTFVIGKNGRSVGRAVGTRDWTSNAARALFRVLLAETAPAR
jgi:peroxiredoxin